MQKCSLCTAIVRCSVANRYGPYLVVLVEGEEGLYGELREASSGLVQYLLDDMAPVLPISYDAAPLGGKEILQQLGGIGVVQPHCAQQQGHPLEAFQPEVLVFLAFAPPLPYPQLSDTVQEGYALTVKNGQ